MGKILCLPKSEFDRMNIKPGYTNDDARYGNDEDCSICLNIIKNSKLEWIERDLAEKDSSYKQIIPYCVVEAWDGFSEVFAYQRTKKGAEGRLHGNWSIGVGGHIEQEDSTGKDFYQTFKEACARELNEELYLSSSNYSYSFMGILYDDSNEVGQVHLGIVMKVMCHCGDVAAEDHMANAKFYHKRDLKSLGVFENWSNILLEEIV